MADQILASIQDASPSPLKPAHGRHLSLTDRTRLSLLRSSQAKTKFTPVSLDDVARLDADDADTTMSLDLSIMTASPCAARGAVEDDLVARTRRSMANFDAAQQRARLARQRSQRKENEAKRAIAGTGRPTKESWIDQLVEEAGEGGGEGEVSAVAEELLSTGQEDYEAVFRSRPRLKSSPAVSRVPSSEWPG